MQLYVMRHAEAVDASETCGKADADRTLTPDGIARAEKMVRALQDLGADVDVVLTSPLTRAVQTGELVARRFKGAKLQTTSLLCPGSKPRALIEEVAAIKAREVLCVGHSPHLELVISKACAGVESPVCELKKAGIAGLDLEVQTRCAILLWLLQPGVVRRLR